jgi:hypothetical protein
MCEEETHVTTPFGEWFLRGPPARGLAGRFYPGHAVQSAFALCPELAAAVRLSSRSAAPTVSMTWSESSTALGWRHATQARGLKAPPPRCMEGDSESAAPGLTRMQKRDRSRSRGGGRL